MSDHAAEKARVLTPSDLGYAAALNDMEAAEAEDRTEGRPCGPCPWVSTDPRDKKITSEPPFSTQITAGAERHNLTPSLTCNVEDWLNADPSLLPELYSGRLVLAETDIKPIWTGDGCDWEPVR